MPSVSRGQGSGASGEPAGEGVSRARKWAASLLSREPAGRGRGAQSGIGGCVSGPDEASVGSGGTEGTAGRGPRGHMASDGWLSTPAPF